MGFLHFGESRCRKQLRRGIVSASAVLVYNEPMFLRGTHANSHTTFRAIFHAAGRHPDIPHRGNGNTVHGTVADVPGRDDGAALSTSQLDATVGAVPRDGKDHHRDTDLRDTHPASRHPGRY